MAGRKPVYDEILTSLKLHDSFDKFEGRYLTDDQISVIRRRAKLLGIEVSVRTVVVTGKKKVYRVA